MTDILLGFSAAGWVFTVAGVSYCIYQYVYLPWKVVRKDMAALAELIAAQNTIIADIRHEMGLRKATAFADADLAEMEQRHRMRDLARSMNGL